MPSVTWNNIPMLQAGGAFQFTRSAGLGGDSGSIRVPMRHFELIRAEPQLDAFFRRIKAAESSYWTTVERNPQPEQLQVKHGMNARVPDGDALDIVGDLVMDGGNGDVITIPDVYLAEEGLRVDTPTEAGGDGPIVEIRLVPLPFWWARLAPIPLHWWNVPHPAGGFYPGSYSPLTGAPWTLAERLNYLLGLVPGAPEMGRTPLDLAEVQPTGGECSGAELAGDQILDLCDRYGLIPCWDLQPSGRLSFWRDGEGQIGEGDDNGSALHRASMADSLMSTAFSYPPRAVRVVGAPTIREHYIAGWGPVGVHRDTGEIVPLSQALISWGMSVEAAAQWVLQKSGNRMTVTGLSKEDLAEIDRWAWRWYQMPEWARRELLPIESLIRMDDQGRRLAPIVYATGYSNRDVDTGSGGPELDSTVERPGDFPSWMEDRQGDTAADKQSKAALRRWRAQRNKRRATAAGEKAQIAELMEMLEAASGDFDPRSTARLLKALAAGEAILPGHGEDVIDPELLSKLREESDAYETQRLLRNLLLNARSRARDASRAKAKDDEDRLNDLDALIASEQARVAQLQAELRTQGSERAIGGLPILPAPKEARDKIRREITAAQERIAAMRQQQALISSGGDPLDPGSALGGATPWITLGLDPVDPQHYELDAVAGLLKFRQPRGTLLDLTVEHIEQTSLAPAVVAVEFAHTENPNLTTEALPPLTPQRWRYTYDAVWAGGRAQPVTRIEDGLAITPVYRDDLRELVLIDGTTNRPDLDRAAWEICRSMLAVPSSLNGAQMVWSSFRAINCNGVVKSVSWSSDGLTAMTSAAAGGGGSGASVTSLRLARIYDQLWGAKGAPSGWYAAGPADKAANERQRVDRFRLLRQAIWSDRK
jgi:hypothetical protein